VISPVANSQSPRARSPAISVAERVGTVGWFRGPGDATVEVASTVLAGVAVTTDLGQTGGENGGPKISFASYSEAAGVGACPASVAVCAVLAVGGISPSLGSKMQRLASLCGSLRREW
jgi:hypothetical protein